ncbi:hypothetical protein [Allobaculum mucilyticum]|uniref:hypothetical protein n=1 Tax=Allobaculum mucilyticum TaxID=2834459 RepID=UPI001E4FFA8F|nr:hypothetical protein [Allobaculum mucilyticum]UNT96581.1 hypothetical protein KWG62_02130 [Allobaculum mucilyticum]
MAQNTSVNGRKGASATMDPEQPYGKNLYFDKKRRMIYTSPLLHEALYIPKYEYRKFNRFKSRYVISAATLMVSWVILDDWFSTPFYVPILLALLVFGLFEFSFYRFQKSLSVVKDFDKSKAVPTQSEVISGDQRTKAWLKVVLYVVLGVLLVVNAYEQHYEGLILYVCWAGLVVCIGFAINILMLILKSGKEQ